MNYSIICIPSAAVLILLDLSAAFDTIDHNILIDKLKSEFGIKGDVIKWIVSYLTKRTYRVKIKNASSIIFNLIFGVPQGSLLGPLLFILYVKELERFAKKHGISIQIYADDTQLYVSVDMQSSQQTKEDIEACLLEIRQWMVQNYLKINTDKTKMILVKSKQNSEDLSFTVLYDNSDVDSCDVAKTLGVSLDSKLSMIKFIQEKCRASYFHLRNLGRIKRSLSIDMRIKLVHNMILSKLDYCNSLLALTPKCHLKKLQKVETAAVRLIYDVPKKCSTSKFLKKAHFLPIEDRIDFKLSLLMFNVVSGKSPCYIAESFSMHSPTRELRVGRDDLNIVYEKKKCKDIFNAMTSKWNDLPINVRNSVNSEIFKSRLKGHLFERAFSNI